MKITVTHQAVITVDEVDLLQMFLQKKDISAVLKERLPGFLRDGEVKDLEIKKGSVDIFYAATSTHKPLDN